MMMAYIAPLAVSSNKGKGKRRRLRERGGERGMMDKSEIEG